jgi:Ca2+-binding RTX toxin-like protein
MQTGETPRTGAAAVIVNSGRKWASLAAALLLLGLLLAQGASAAAKCEYDPSSHLLSVTTSGGNPLEETEVRRVGPNIEVGSFFGPRANCHGSPTVTNTDRINVVAKGASEVTIDLSGGPFAPGATPDPGPSSEIEIVLSGSGAFFLEGGPRADHFRYATIAGQEGLNLNAGPDDRDLDVILPNPETEIFVDSGSGSDTIDVAGNPKVEVLAFAGAGNDTLIGRRGVGGLGSLLDGGSGRDRIFGGPSFDYVVPGSGSDVVKARGGYDLVVMKADKRKDRIDCGTGRDEVAKPDPFDHLRSCERVKRG